MKGNKDFHKRQFWYGAIALSVAPFFKIQKTFTLYNNKFGSEVWDDNKFNSFKGMFVYRGCNLMKIIGGWNVFNDTHPIKASSRQQVDEIIDNACIAIKKSIK